MIRRRVSSVDGTIFMTDGSTQPVDAKLLIRPLELALRAMSWSIVLVAAALAVARLG
jgi:hypothetical protein